MKKDERLELILKHAATVFFERGFDRASIRDVARAADMSLAGLYYYFRSKDELLYLIQEKVFKELIGSVRSRIETVSDPIRRLDLFIHNHLEYFVRNLVEMKVLSHEFESLDGEHHEAIRQIRREYYRIAEGIVEEVQRRWPRKEITPRLAVLGLFGMMNWLYTWYKPAVDGSAESVAAQMSALFLSGLLPERKV